MNPHRRFGISRGTQDSGKDDPGNAEEHGRADDTEIQRRVPPDRRLRPEPVREMGTDRQRQHRHHDAEYPHEQLGLPCGFYHPLPVSCASGLRDTGQNAGRNRPERRVNKPGGRGAQSHGCRGGCSQLADLRGIHILNDRLQRGLCYGGPGQTQNVSLHPPVAQQKKGGTCHGSS